MEYSSEAPPFLENLEHVASLLWYDGEILGHYKMEGQSWLMLWTNFETRGATYWESHVYVDITEQHLTELLANTMPLRDALKAATIMWREECTWHYDAKGHGIAGTHVYQWAPMKWMDFPKNELPLKDVCLHLDSASSPSSKINVSTNQLFEVPPHLGR